MTAGHTHRVGFSFAAVAAVVAWLSWPVAATLAANVPGQAEPAAAAPAGDCARCHSCANPTADEPCLLKCTRPTAPAATPKAMGPDVVILDRIEGPYLPVPFDHRGHATMAEMGRGCVTCHHYTPEGQPHPSCIACHDPSTEGTDIHKPGLKGAYHQQCLNCHRDWIDETKCFVCHRLKAGQEQQNDKSPTKDDILGRMHPPIPRPTGDLYPTTVSVPGGTAVIFRHEDHVKRFGIACVDCHRESSCAQCHTGGPATSRPTSVAEFHARCVQCHKRDMTLAAREAGRCERCHWIEGHPKPAAFDHEEVGWPLGRYHARIGCRDCHKQVPFVALPADCNACHADWVTGSFDHRVTGQVLDENHAAIDCETCHPRRRFSDPPVCTECHEDNTAFPAKRPGSYVGL